MKKKLIQYHQSELRKAEHALESWIKPGPSIVDSKSYIKTLKKLVQFHKDVLVWLRAV